MDPLLGFIADGLSDVFVTGTYVNKKEALQHAIAVHNEAVNEAKGQVKSEYWSMLTIMQPWPTLFAEQSAKRGGNVLGLERFDQNMFRKYCSPYSTTLKIIDR